jgi:Trypsin-co-occurring domain 1
LARGGVYEVGVAIAALDGYGAGLPDGGPGPGQGSVPGFEDTAGLKRAKTGRNLDLIEKGDAAVRAATEAIAGQIGVTAQRIAAAIGAQAEPMAQDQVFALETVEVSFGVTLTAGLQTIFTAMAESSAQVTITLSRQTGDDVAAGSSGAPGT